jgi:hypothetical protein
MMDLFLCDQDVKIVEGDLAICPTDADTIAQAIVIRLKTLAGEWFLDSALGIPYFTEIFGHKRNSRFIRQLLLPEIEAVPGVHQVKDFEVHEKTNRQLLIKFNAVLSSGTVVTINESMGV